MDNQDFSLPRTKSTIRFVYSNASHKKLSTVSISPIKAGFAPLFSRALCLLRYGRGWPLDQGEARSIMVPVSYNHECNNQEKTR